MKRIQNQQGVIELVVIVILALVIGVASFAVYTHYKAQNAEIATCPIDPSPLKFVNTEPYRSQIANAETLKEAETNLNNFGSQFDYPDQASGKSGNCLGVQGPMFAITEHAYIHGNSNFVPPHFEHLSESDLPKLKVFGQTLIDQFAKYPAQWLDKGATGVGLYKHLSDDNNPEIGGTVDGVIYFSTQSGDPVYDARLIHHELNHLFDLIFFGESMKDPNWIKLNTPDYQTYQYPPHNDDAFTEHPKTGFVTGYAETNPQEDKAETYTYLFTNYKTLMGWADTDSTLRAKVDYLKAFIKSKVPAMDDAYFEQRVSKE